MDSKYIDTYKAVYLNHDGLEYTVYVAAGDVKQAIEKIEKAEHVPAKKRSGCYSELKLISINIENDIDMLII